MHKLHANAAMYVQSYIKAHKCYTKGQLVNYASYSKMIKIVYYDKWFISDRLSGGGKWNRDIDKINEDYN